MDILAKLPCCIKARIFLYLQHPVATIYRAVCLQPAWYRDAACVLSHIESLEQAFLCEEYDAMKDVLIAIDEHFRCHEAGSAAGSPRCSGAAAADRAEHVHQSAAIQPAI